MRNTLFTFSREAKWECRTLVLVTLGLAIALATGCGNSKTVSADLASADPAAEGAAAVEPSNPTPVRWTIPDGTVLTVRLLQSISSASARSGDEFDAELSNPLTIGGNQVFPKGAQIRGRVVSAKKSGRLHDPGRLRLTMKSIKTPNGQWITVESSSYYAQGQSHKKRNLTLIGGGTGVGALIGGLVGGGKGLAIGAASGAAAGTAGAAATGQKDVTLSSERILHFTLKAPLSVSKSPSD